MLAYLRDYPQLSEKGTKILFPFPTIYFFKETFKEERIPILHRFFEIVEEGGILLNSFYEIDPDTKTRRGKNEIPVKIKI